MDWKEMEAEYVTGGASYRALAEKYGVSLGTVKHRGARDGWVAGRQAHKEEVMRKVLTADTERILSRMERLQGVGDVLLERVEEMVPEIESPAALKTLTEALKNIRDAQMLKESNRAESEKQTITVVLEGVGEFVS